MEDRAEMPRQVCHCCAAHVTAFLPFIKLCKESASRWTDLSQYLLGIPFHTKATTAFILVSDGVRIRTVLEYRDRKKNLDARNVIKRVNCLQKVERQIEIVPGQEVDKIMWNSNVYTCVECGGEYRKLSKINLHLANQNKRLCRHCQEIVNLKTFGEHLQTHGILFFKCKICSLTFETNKQFDKHKNVHKGRFMCAECKRAFSTTDTLTLHVHRKHQADVCTNCNLKFSNRVCLYKHRLECGSLAKTYICDYCCKQFNDRSVIKSHITLVHSRRLLHQCERCGKRFNSASHLVEHRETHDVIEDRFACQFCDRVYRTSGGFRRHLRQKHYSVNPELKSKRRYSCNTCRRSFISEKNLNNHFKTKKHKVDDDAILPPGLCRACAEDVVTAAKFKHLCDKSAQRWGDAALYLARINLADDDKTLFLICDNNDVLLTEKRVRTVRSAVTTLQKFKAEKIIKQKQKEFACACPFCDKPFLSLDTLNEHLKRGQKRACCDCGLVLWKSEMSQHSRDVHGTESVQCQACHEPFLSRREAERHEMQYHGPDSISCEDCGRGYRNLRGLRSHRYSHSLFCCAACGRSFENNRCYRHHRSNCAPLPKPEVETYECHECGLRYDKKPSLKIHIVQKHLNVLPHSCRICGKRTSTLAHLRSHERVHEKVRETIACHCGAKFRTELGHRLHMRNHSGLKPYKCEECEERFISASRRLDHAKRRHASRSSLPHACRRCPARFIRPWELRKHKETCRDPHDHDT